MFYDVYEDRKMQEGMQDTWGHLAPKKRQSYKGYIICAYGEYGDIVLLDAEFENLNDSPWLYEAMQDFIGENCKDKGLYIWKGSFRKVNNNNCFDGELARLKFEELKTYPISIAGRP